jgi:FkbM family methyltransferase
MSPAWLRGYVRQNRRNRLIRKTAKLCQSFLSWYNNATYEQDANGELFVLERLSRFPIKLIFDVGANVGVWTSAARAAFPAASIHSFEICQETFDTLTHNTKALSDVHCVNIGLGDREGNVKLHYYDRHSGLTTIFDYPHNLPATEITATVTTGAAYCKRLGIKRIDLIKIDAEGMDHLILDGFREMMHVGAIDVIQFEYGQVSILSKFLLYDFYALLKQYGYVVGKIFPNFVDFRDYSMSDEDFIGPNYLACRAEKQEYIDVLK